MSFLMNKSSMYGIYKVRFWYIWFAGSRSFITRLTTHYNFQPTSTQCNFEPSIAAAKIEVKIVMSPLTASSTFQTSKVTKYSLNIAELASEGTHYRNLHHPRCRLHAAFIPTNQLWLPTTFGLITTIHNLHHYSPSTTISSTKVCANQLFSRYPARFTRERSSRRTSHLSLSPSHLHPSLTFPIAIGNERTIVSTDKIKHLATRYHLLFTVLYSNLESSSDI